MIKAGSILNSFQSFFKTQSVILLIWFALSLILDAAPFMPTKGSILFEPLPLKAEEKAEIRSDDFFSKLAGAAEERLKYRVKYDGAYIKIGYPMGDVPSHIGVCTDVLIRTYRALGIDLQKEVHMDMKKNFSHYPDKWGLKKPDTNIDHRRVANLMTFFTRMGAELPISSDPESFRPGDIVAWNLGSGLLHIGIVSHQKAKNGTPLIVHNIGMGPKMDNMLFYYTIIGHYRYEGKPSNPAARNVSE